MKGSGAPAVTEAGLPAEVGSSPLAAEEDAVCCVAVAVAVPRALQPAPDAGGGPEPCGAAGAEPAVCCAAWAEPGFAGDPFQHPVGDCDPYGILCLQAHSASVTARQASPSESVWEQNKLCCSWVSGEVESEMSGLETTSGLDSW
nr:uncharacterized protein C12orf76 homolog [Camelus dromedarius]